jgi:hypothetical protein
VYVFLFFERLGQCDFGRQGVIWIHEVSRDREDEVMQDRGEMNRMM